MSLRWIVCSSATKENEEMDRECCPDEDPTRTEPAKEPIFLEYWRGNIVFRKGDCVLFVVSGCWKRTRK